MWQRLLNALDRIGRFPHPNVFGKSAKQPSDKALSGADVFKLWSPPAGSPWFSFAKATLFASLDANQLDFLNFDAPNIAITPVSMTAMDKPFEWPGTSVAVIADLPHDHSVLLADHFSKQYGYQPVALFNNWPHKRGLIRCENVAATLSTLAPQRTEFAVSTSAPPFFMIQGERLSGLPVVHDFDNRYFVSEEDLPTAAYLKKHGIQNMAYIHDSPATADDLISYFCILHAAGISLWIVDITKSLHDTTLLTPVPRVTALSNFLLAQFSDFRRSGAGGFGGLISPKSSGG